MIIYDKNLERTLDIPQRQAELMLKYRPQRYIRAAEVNEVKPSGGKADKGYEKPAENGDKPTKDQDEPTKPAPDSDQPTKPAEINATRGAIEAAEELGVNLSDLPVEGRITKSDVTNFKK